MDVEEEEGENNKVSLMTVHSSKGLEYPYVFVIGMEENIFPSGGWLANDTEIEEERRLFYVAMTRAKKVLQLSFAQTRMRNGKHESNAPSRFVREINDMYILNPLTAEEAAGDSNDSGNSGWRGGQNSSRFTNNYSRSSQPIVQSRRPAQSAQAVSARPVKPSTSIPAPRPISRSQSLQPRTPDADFQPTPILQLKPGQRIEHNRFGYGQILEISGSAIDLKAKILFDEHGEKILILKYAKIRTI